MQSEHLRPAFPKVQATTTGVVRRNGEFPGKKLNFADHVRCWGTWAGSDDNKGELRIGPFPGPDIIRFALGGYPSHDGIRVFVELADGSSQSAIEAPNIGERWQVRQHKLPDDWRGRDVFLCAVDAATGSGRWISISEPVRVGFWGKYENVLQGLTCWTINGFLLGCLFLSIARGLGRTQLPPEWIALMAGAVIALIGYGVFWIYFCDPIAGKVASFVLMAIGVVTAWATSSRKVNPLPPWPVCKLLLGVSFFYFAMLYLYWSPLDFYVLAENRFNQRLPPDNYLSYLVANNLTNGESLKTPMGDWLVSDRPPFQTGWILLTLPITGLLGLDERAFSGTSALWFQCLWIAAAYGLLRGLKVTVFRTYAWIAVLALSGFFVQNTTFTWPKLAAGAFACGAFAFWFLLTPKSRPYGRFAVAGALAAVAWLTHGGVAFAFLPIAAWALWRCFRGELRLWLCSAAVFALLAAPWFCFQQFYNPPGNRLLKWHLAGQSAVDPRGTLQTLRDSYSSHSVTELIAARVQNFETQFGGDWLSLFTFDKDRAQVRRQTEFYHMARALTWWCVGSFWLPLLLLRSRNSRALAVWVLATVIVWCLLIFIGGDAIIHQGSYTVPMVGFVLLSASLNAASRWTLPLVAVAQAATFLTTYLVPNSIVNGDAIGLPLLIVAVLGIAAVLMMERLKSEPAAVAEETNTLPRS